MSPGLLPDPFDVTLAILAGGEGSRMGTPKGQLTLSGRPILDYLLDQLAWAGPTLLVTAPGREHPPAWERFTQEAADPASGGGPLRGVLTALEHLATPLLLVLTVDMPGIRPVHCQTMLDLFHNHPQAMGLMLTRPHGSETQIEPFPLLLRAAAKESIARQLADNRRSVHGLLALPGFVSVPAPTDWHEAAWVNLNRPSDLIDLQTVREK